MIKRTITEAGYGARGTARAYLENLRRQNLMFDAGYILEGLVLETDKLQFLVSQPFIEGVEASDAQIEAFFGGCQARQHLHQFPGHPLPH